MAAEHTPTPFDSLLGEDNQDVEALEKLEARVLHMVEQLRDARGRQIAAEKEAEALRKQLSETERRVAELETRTDEGRSSRKVVRSRIESLLERIETLEEK